MLTVGSVRDIETILNYHTGQWVFGMLFYRPDTTLGRTIFASRDYWDVRSGEYLDLLCVGYVSVDEPGFRKLGPAGPWYSDSAFNDIRAWAESEFDWRYSGDADLVLLEATRHDVDHDAVLGAIVSLSLASLPASFSVSTVLEHVCSYAESGPGDLNVLSDIGAIKALIGEFTRRFPGVRQALDFRVRRLPRRV